MTILISRWVALAWLEGYTLHDDCEIHELRELRKLREQRELSLLRALGRLIELRELFICARRAQYVL